MTLDAEPSDSALARLAAAGDDRAFAVLVGRHKRRLYRLLRHYSGDPEDAYEAVQEAFIAAWGAMRRYDSQRPFAAWLTTIAINKARDHGRRAAVRRLVFGPEPIDSDEALAAADLATRADQAMIEGELTGRLDAAIGRLPAALKGPLILTAFEGLSHQEAGRILGVSPKAVELRVSRARKVLAERLDDDMRPSSG